MKIPQFIKSFIIGLPIGITFIDSIGYIARVDGTSMQPALNPDKNTTDYVFLNRWSVKSFDIKRGDIVSLTSPKDASQKIIKRVVGVQGDIIATLGYKRSLIKVPEGHCWVEGDHKGHSLDSNNFGPVSVGLINAKASCIVWPPSRWQVIQSSLPESREPLNVNSKILVDEFDFCGNVARNALTLGDVDNDGNIEFVIGNEDGEVAIFKGNQLWQKMSNFSFVTCIAVGDVLNIKQNCLLIVTADGWCHIYYTPPSNKNQPESSSGDVVDGQMISTESTESDKNIPLEIIDNSSQISKNYLKSVHVQRIPANAMDVIIGDIDGDGLTEIVFGLTDRVVRSYRWISKEPGANSTNTEFKHTVDVTTGLIQGQLVVLNKWECASQIGSITLNHSLCGKPHILVSQPGGTFMRITCEESIATSSEILKDPDKASLQSEKLVGSSVDYQFLGLSRMRNQNISTEILGDFNNIKHLPEKPCQKSNLDCENCKKSKPYSVATLDGTIMLVQDEVILWAMAVDHQIFALEKLDVTNNGSDDIVACTWDGYTYILDQDRNSVRFQVGESVQAFCCGYYSLISGKPPLTCLVYVTFRNKVYLYYDVPLTEMCIKKIQPNFMKLEQLLKEHGKEEEIKNMNEANKKKLVEYFLYGIKGK